MTGDFALTDEVVVGVVVVDVEAVVSKEPDSEDDDDRPPLISSRAKSGGGVPSTMAACVPRPWWMRSPLLGLRFRSWRRAALFEEVPWTTSIQFFLTSLNKRRRAA